MCVGLLDGCEEATCDAALGYRISVRVREGPDLCGRGRSMRAGHSSGSGAQLSLRLVDPEEVKAEEEEEEERGQSVHLTYKRALHIIRSLSAFLVQLNRPRG